MMKKTAIAAQLVLAGVIGMNTGAAMALEAGDWLVRGRVINIMPNDDSSLLNLNGANVAGSGAAVDSGMSLDIDFTYMLTSEWGVELLLDISSRHDIDALGVAGLGKIAEVSTLPPTLFLQYHFNGSSTIRPYAGVGLNFTTFLNEDTTAAYNAAFGASTLELDNSWGLAAQVGMDIDMGNDWFWNVDVKYIDIDTDATFTSATNTVTADVEVDPWVVGIGIGTRF